MLEEYFCNTRTLHELHLGPFGERIDMFAQMLRDEGYSRHTARNLIHDVAHLSRYLLWKGIGDISQVTLSDFDDFMSNHIPNCNCMRPNEQKFRHVPAAMAKLRECMQIWGYFSREERRAFAPNSIDGILSRYRDYLEKIRANSGKTIDIHLRTLRRFLTIRERMHGNIDLKGITKPEILEIHSALVKAHPHSLDWLSSTTSSLRCFLRFLHWDRIVDETFIGLLPRVCQWSMADLPKGLTKDELERLLDSPDPSTANGIRDRLVLLLLATLGLRASEVAKISLDDVQWRKKVLVVHTQKTKKELRLPVGDSVLAALRDYIIKARPKCEFREILVRSVAPIRPFRSSSAITSIVRLHMTRAGIVREQNRGAHALRHTFATLMINSGVELKDISDLLGHAHVETTRIYAKVDLASLRKVICEFPKCDWEA